MRMWVQSLASISRLRIPRMRSLGCRLQKRLESGVTGCIHQFSSLLCNSSLLEANIPLSVWIWLTTLVSHISGITQFLFLPFFFFFFRGVAYGKRLNRSYFLLAHVMGAATRHWANSATFTTAEGNARSRTHWERPGIEPTSLWIPVRFIIIEPQRELPQSVFVCLAMLQHVEIWGPKMEPVPQL